MTAPENQDDKATDDAALEDASSDAADSGDAAEKDWQAEYEAMKRINRDLERKNKRSYDAIRKEIDAKYRTELTEARKAAAAGSGDDKAKGPDLDTLRAEIKAEARAETAKDRALDKLEAKAARLFQNPEDARAFLADKVGDFIDDGGKVDVEAITDALDDLLKQRPYLGVTQGDTKRFKGTGDGGPKGNAGKPQLTRADLKGMSPDAILTAKAEGRMNNLLGIT